MSDTENKFVALLAEVDVLLKEGKSGAARARLLHLKTHQVPAQYRLACAKSSRRAGIPHLGLKFLNSVVRPTGRLTQAATAEEIAEYGADLIGVGASSEALVLLASVKADVPEVMLFQAFAHFAQWNYRDAIPFLERYLRHPRIQGYSRLIGLANLGSALVHERAPAARYVLNELVTQTQKEKLPLLEGNARLFSAELEIYDRDWRTARHHLDKAERIFSGSESLEPLFLRKWRAVLEMSQAANPTVKTAAIERVRNEALERRHWETVRDCDFHLAVCLKKPALAIHLIYGTPFASFREHLTKIFSETLEMPPAYTLELGTVEKEGSVYSLDLQTGVMGKKRAKLKVGQLPHRLLRTLASDFYRPFRGAQIHSALFPDEYFNPNSSPQRVRQLIARLRATLSENKTPLEIIESEGAYRLRATSATRLRIPNRAPLSSVGLWVERLRQAFEGRESFTAAEVSAALETNLWTVRLALKNAKREGFLRQVGKGPASGYLFEESLPAMKKAG